MLESCILEKLVCFTDEEIDLLNGKKQIDKSIYLNNQSHVIDYHKLLVNNQQLSVRKHVRFCEYPTHSHNYIELMYVYSGQMTHIIDGQEITIYEGELLLLNQNIEHSIQYTNENDIIFNFIIKPDFLNYLSTIVKQKNIVLNFIFDALYSYNNDGEYLLFKVSDNLLIKNYIESVITHIYKPSLNNDLELKLLMGLLLTELMNFPENIVSYSKQSSHRLLSSQILKYIVNHYQNGSLQELSEILHLPNYVICKIIKNTTGKTFKQLLQDMRFNKAIFFLENTHLTIEQIIAEIGYENETYFYRIFKKRYAKTPYEYRNQLKERRIENV